MTSTEKEIVSQVIMSADSSERLYNLARGLDQMYELSQHIPLFGILLGLTLLAFSLKLRKTGLFFQIGTAASCLLFKSIPILFYGGLVFIPFSIILVILEVLKYFKHDPDDELEQN